VRLDRPLLVAGIVNLAAAVPAAAGLILDGRLVMGINPWIKPSKFLISVGIYLVTLAWMLPRVQGHARAVSAIRWTAIVTMIGENVLIVTQAARGTTSHFNITSIFDTAVFNAMGLLIIGNTVAAAWLLGLFLRAPAPMARPVLAGVRYGLALFLAAGAVGGMMVSAGAHAVGVPDGGPGLPLVNWSTKGGDLRIAHFLGLHALQALPLLGWLLRARSDAVGVWAVRLVAGAWAIAFVWLLRGALAGQPLIRF